MDLGDDLDTLRPETLLRPATSAARVPTERERDDALAPQAMREIVEALTNELSAPALLPFKRVAFARLKRVMDARVREAERKEARQAAASLTPTQLTRNEMRAAALQMDIDRVRYVLAAYVRARLRKVERFAQHLLEQRALGKVDASALLCDAEWEHAERYESLRVASLKRSVVSRLLEATGQAPPPEHGGDHDDAENEDDEGGLHSLHRDETQDMTRRPFTKTFVLAHVNVDLGDIEAVRNPNSAAKVSARQGSTLTAQWELIEPYVRTGQVTLL